MLDDPHSSDASVRFAHSRPSPPKVAEQDARCGPLLMWGRIVRRIKSGRVENGERSLSFNPKSAPEGGAVRAAGGRFVVRDVRGAAGGGRVAACRAVDLPKAIARQRGAGAR